MSKGDKAAGGVARLGSSVKSLVKMALQSRRCGVKAVAREDEALVVMGNGPSLRQTIDTERDELKRHRLLAVNFAANAPEFDELRPDFYVLSDPVFFRDMDNENVKLLWRNLGSVTDWDMTLLVPADAVVPVELPATVRVERFNAVGVEGFAGLERWAFRKGLGMPRPRNVLIPSIMMGMALGFKRIYVVGADHSWSRTLEVTDENVVVSVQPHFYEDNAAEHARVASVYKDVRLHEIMYSFYVAFKSYFAIRSYADACGVRIFNSTPGSFIDAFERRGLGK